MRRQSIDPEDLFHAHIGAMDLCARALLVAEKMIADDALGRHRRALRRLEGKLGRDILAGRRSFAARRAVDKHALDPQPRSGRQERLEALVNKYI